MAILINFNKLVVIYILTVNLEHGANVPYLTSNDGSTIITALVKGTKHKL